MRWVGDARVTLGIDYDAVGGRHRRDLSPSPIPNAGMFRPDGG